MPTSARPRPAAQRLRSTDAPLYASLAKSLADAIRLGQYAEGGLLPTEARLAELYSVSRQTVREALRRLHEQGLVSRRRGVGTRVERAAGQRRYVLEVGSMSDIVEYAKQVRLTVEAIEPVVAGAALAAQLGCRVGSRWVEVRGWRAAADDADTAVAVTRFWIRGDYPGIERRLRELDGAAVHQVLEDEFGEQIDEIVQEISAIPIPADDACRLGVARGSPGLRIHRRFHGRGGRAVIVGHVVYPGDAFAHTGRFRRDRD